MPFNYTDLKGTDKIKDMYPKVNELGNYMKNNVNPTNVSMVNNVDFNNILASIPDSGFYYITNGTNIPTGVSSAGYVHLQKRTGNYHRITYMPYNLSTMYIKINNNGTLTDWQKVKMDDGGVYDFGKTLDVKTLKESTIQYATVLNPPSPDINEGWVDFKYARNGLSTAQFTPINSESIYAKTQKLPTQTQNPNILEDATFRNTIVGSDTFKTGNEKGKWESYNALINPAPDITFQGQNAVQVYSDGNSQYPSVISKPLVVGKDVNIGDTLTLSVYAMVPDTSVLTDRIPYLDVAGYSDMVQNSNPTLGQYTFNPSTMKAGEWKKYSVTVKVTPTNIEGKTVKYVKALLRLNCSKNVSKGAKIYYALPKLEKGGTVTPFISNSNDKYQYDEIWTQWLEYPDLNKVNRYTPSDVTNNGFFDFLWDATAQDGKTFQDLVNTVPQGFHTFYCNHKIDGAPSSVSPVRGTILIDHIGGADKTQPTRGVIQCIDSTGKMYVYYKHDTEITQTSQLQGSTFLWEGSLDLSEINKTVTLADDPQNYDYIEISYYVNSSGVDNTVKQSLAKGNPTITIRAFNLPDTNSVGLTLWEGSLTMSGKSLSPTRVLRIGYNTSRNVLEAQSFNTKGEIYLYKVVGIRSI